MKKLFAGAAVAIRGASALWAIALIALPSPVLAKSVYKSQNFTVEVGFDNSGWTYKGCDTQKHCINLTGGNRWHENGEKGIFWENKEYTYSVFSQDSQPGDIYLRIRKNGKEIMRQKLK